MGIKCTRNALVSVSVAWLFENFLLLLDTLPNVVVWYKRHLYIITKHTIEFQIITINISCILQYLLMSSYVHRSSRYCIVSQCKSHILFCVPKEFFLKIINTDTIIPWLFMMTAWTCGCIQWKKVKKVSSYMPSRNK